ncbi:FAD-dependent oxidoreductase, partial [Streptomyces sp. NPDC057621]|uniref:FAD-dependent oxidoreductase n=1 Tax=Streptomyces sp. NPDC057621 TaxID=3346186 RepID=UPI003678AC80
MATSADPARRTNAPRPSSPAGPSRRRVLGAATGTGLALAAGLPGAARAADLPPLGTYDVVVVGSGAAGMTAALTAAKQGLSCVVVEKAATFGGSAA